MIDVVEQVVVHDLGASREERRDLAVPDLLQLGELGFIIYPLQHQIDLVEAVLHGLPPPPSL
ncbi:hypothetical protein D3C73_1605940 [compost metagenome]